jgi:hypothetical protein
MQEKKFTPFHAQMDYETDVVDVQFEGDYVDERDRAEAIRYAKESYPSLQGKILYSYPPSEVKGYNNMGLVGIV